MDQQNTTNHEGSNDSDTSARGPGTEVATSNLASVLQLIPQAMSRAARAPGVGVTGSLQSRGSDFDNDFQRSRQPRQRQQQQNEVGATDQQDSRNHNQNTLTSARSHDAQNRMTEVTDATDLTDLLSMPTLTRQTGLDSDDDLEIHRNMGSSVLSDLLRRYANEHESTTTLISGLDMLPNSNRWIGSERSSETRRSLARALRDYRAARRALRSHSLGEGGNEDARVAGLPSGLSRLREQNALVDSIAALSEGNNSWQTDEDQGLSAETGTRSTSNEASATSSVPTVAALRAARLAVQRSAGSATASDAMEASGGQRTRATSTERLIAMRMAQSAGRQGEPTIILDDPRGTEGTTVDPVWPGLSPRPVTGIDDNTDSSIRPVDLNVNSRRRLDASLQQNHPRDQKIKDTSRSEKAKAALGYLTQLKEAAHNGIPTAVLAQEMGVDSIKESLEKETVFDLPLRLDELPVPVQSSWLECGVSWSGEQASKFARLPSPVLRTPNLNIPIWAQSASRTREDSDRLLNSRARRHRERLRAERLEREQQLQGSGPVSGQTLSNFGLPLTGSIEILADMERHLSDLLEEEERLLNADPSWIMPGSLLGRQRARQPDTTGIVAENRWPVKVKLHSVDLEKMTVEGTMSASHMPNRNWPVWEDDLTKSDDKDTSRVVESLFDGEIIDFLHNEIETRENKRGYQCGGLEVDVQYWAGIGPFREEVERQKNAIRYQKQLGVDNARDDTESGTAVLEVIKTGTRESYDLIIKSLRDCSMIDESALSVEEKMQAVDEAMIRCLGSKKWINQKLGKEWILMRWKERCFITPSAKDSASSSSAQISTRTTIYSSDDPSSWGLTISGFYYIAMHRQTGKIEGLYYDPGSQPFQRLEMWPVDSGRKVTASTNPGQKQQDPSSSTAAAEPPSSSTQSAASSSNLADPKDSINQVLATGYNDDIIGVRKWFPASEFRR